MIIDRKKCTFAPAKKDSLGFYKLNLSLCFICVYNYCKPDVKTYILYQQSKYLIVNTLSYKTQSANKQTVKHDWYVVDAAGMKVGRLASKIAHVIRGKHKPSFTPHVDTGDYVIVLNAHKVRFTGAKMEQKEYITFSGYPGGQKRVIAKEMMAKHPERIMEAAVRGMLPKTKLGRAMLKKLFVYTTDTHNHQAQKPQKFNF